MIRPIPHQHECSPWLLAGTFIVGLVLGIWVCA